MKKHILLTALAAAALLTSGITAHAQAVAGNGFSDTLTVFDATGKVVNFVGVDEANESNSQIYFINDASIIDASQFGNPTNIVEPNGSFSDIFGIANVNGGSFLAFNSDSEVAGAAFAGVGSIVKPEGNGIFDATMYLNPNLRGAGYTAIFQSDATSVPEASPAAMLGIGLAGLAMLMFFKRRQVA